MKYTEYKPHPFLSDYIECYWSAYAERPPFREQESLIPDGTYPFFGIPAHLFANGFFTLEELIGPEYKTIEEKLFGIRDNKKRVEIIEDYLFKKFSDQPEDHSFVKHCLELLDRPDRIKIGDLAGQFNTNYKTIERKFDKVVGLTPSHFLKIRRFNRALFTIYSLKHKTLTDAAIDSGYYDQSHFNREFRQLTGLSPGDFLREQFKIVEVIQPALAGRLSNSYKF